MTTPAASLSVFACDEYACVRITGRANFTLGVEFKMLLTELEAYGFGRFIFELSDCVLMDSTFLGILTGFGLKQQQLRGEDQPSVVELRNPHERVAELIENLGVLSLFKIERGPLCPVDKLHVVVRQPAEPSREETTRVCLEAHEKLVEANADNAQRFKDVTHFLAEDLKRMKKPGA